MSGSVYPLLSALRDALATVPGVATCKIGLEATMTPADYPMVRLVASRITDGAVIGRRSVDLLIYFGQPIHEFDAGLQAQYESLLAMEVALRDKASQTATVLYRETILDEDRVDAYKLMAIRCEVQG
jgi:hypothetical protein